MKLILSIIFTILIFETKINGQTGLVDKVPDKTLELENQTPEGIPNTHYASSNRLEKDQFDKKNESRIHFFITFKNPLFLCQVLIAVLMSICFIQSGLDKIIDRKGNLEYFYKHFKNTPIKHITGFCLTFITFVELTGGLLCAIGVPYAFIESDITLIASGLIILSLNIILLFAGQRIAKDYAGAADLVPYFILVMLGIMSMY